MTTQFTSLPPPTLSATAPSGGAAGQAPVAFRSYRGAKSGSRGSMFIAEAPSGAISMTGEFYPPAKLMAFRIGQLVLSFVAVASLISYIVVLAGRETGADTPPLAYLALAATFAASIALLVWKAILVSNVRPATLMVRAVDLRRVRTTVNYSTLWWWLLIGPFVLIALFTGRRRLRFQVPVDADGRVGLLPIDLLEQNRGDAELVAVRLRMARTG